MNKAITLLALATIFSGCSLARHPVYPGQSAYIEALTVKYASGTFPKDAYTNSYSRNQVVNELTILINENYSSYERSFYTSDAALNTAADVIGLGLSSAATVVGGEAVKAALAATITGISGVKMAVSKEFFAEKSRVAVITKMRAMRVDALAVIEDRKSLPIEEYPLSKALIDLQTLVEAGTVVSGLEGLVQSSSESLAAANLKMDNVKLAKPKR